MGHFEDYFMMAITGSFLLSSYIIGKKIKKRLEEENERRLNYELNTDLSLLSKLPKNPYVILSADEQIVIDQQKTTLQYMRTKYFTNELEALLDAIPEGERKRELRVKERIIKKRLEEMSLILP